MVNYKNGKIYKIINDENEECYIGSTVKKLLSARFAEHKSSYNRWKNNNDHFMSSFVLFEKYGIENCKIILIENYPCDNKDELRAREEYYRKEHKTVNKYKSYITEQEKKEKNNKNIKKRYAENEKYREQAKDRANKYRKKNIIKVKKYDCERNKKKNKMYSKIKKICECSASINYKNYSQHKKTKKHIKAMNEITDI